MENQTQTVIVRNEKSMLVTILLTFFFGPLGMFYSTVGGAVIMLVVSFIVGILTLGFGLIITHPTCIIWAAVAANNYNKNLGLQSTR
ncbi:MAG: hypothetical protein K8H86_09615 [Ignavibacteriaceae bacterium]|nr:hypothetical protein [Ignavibacteriaceae bacterium]